MPCAKVLLRVISGRNYQRNIWCATTCISANVTRITRPHVTVLMQSKSKLTVPLVSLSLLWAARLWYESERSVRQVDCSPVCKILFLEGVNGFLLTQCLLRNLFNFTTSQSLNKETVVWSIQSGNATFVNNKNWTPSILGCLLCYYVRFSSQQSKSYLHFRLPVPWNLYA